jgi:hypothetical protein
VEKICQEDENGWMTKTGGRNLYMRNSQDLPLCFYMTKGVPAVKGKMEALCTDPKYEEDGIWHQALHQGECTIPI